MYIHIMYTCKHMYYSHVHICTVHMYCTHKLYIGTVHMYIEHYFLCTCVQLSLPPVHAPCPGPAAVPKSDLLEVLQLTVEEADKCQKVAH